VPCFTLFLFFLPFLFQDFAHHTRDPGVRKEVAAWLKELHESPNRRDTFSIPLPQRVFGSAVHNVTLMMDEALAWIKTIDRRRKEWITGWQMDMWGR
jgi:hypothetical protein